MEELYFYYMVSDDYVKSIDTRPPAMVFLSHEEIGEFASANPNYIVFHSDVDIYPEFPAQVRQDGVWRRIDSGGRLYDT